MLCALAADKAERSGVCRSIDRRCVGGACSTPHHHLPVHTLDYPLRSPRVFAEAPSYHLILQYQEWDCADFPAEFFHISYWYLSCNTIDNRQLTNPHNKSRAGQGFGSLFSPSQMGRSSISCQAFTGGAWCSLVSFPNPLESEVENLSRCSPPSHPLPVGRANGSVGAGSSCHPPTAHFWGRSPV